MNPFWHYLIRVSMALLPFYLLYIVAIRRLTFFRWNRLYLISSLLIAVLVPFISFRSMTPVFQYLPVQNMAPTTTSTPATSTWTPVATNTTSLNWLLILGIIYGIGVLVSLCRLLVSIGKIIYTVQSHEKANWQGYKIICNRDVHINASFFHFIFVQPSLTPEEQQTIITHESIHARKWHSVDILLLELFKIVWWFHPAAHHYKSLLQQAHEFEVDEESTLTTNKKSYAHLLLKLQQNYTPMVLSLYGHPSITQRIHMLFKKKSGNANKLFYLLVMPCLLLTAVYCSKRTTDVQHQPMSLELMTATPKKYGTVLEGSQKLHYIFDPTRIQSLEDYHAFLGGGEFEEIGKLFKQHKVVLNTLTFSKTSGPTEQIGFLLYGKKGNVQATFRMQELLQQNLDIDLTVEKETGKVSVRSIPKYPASKEPEEETALNGKQLFTANCAACHNIEKDMTGPALAGIEQRRNKAWIFAFTRNSAALIASKDTQAVKIYNEWGQVPMSVFPQMTDQHIEAILKYIRNVDKQQAVAAK